MVVVKNIKSLKMDKFIYKWIFDSSKLCFYILKCISN